MKIKILIIIFFLQSCSIIPKTIILTNCSEVNKELSSRYNLFQEINDDEIKKRHLVNVKTVSTLDEFSVVSEIIKSIKSSEKNAKLIPVDLRYYHDVSLGNIIISNISNDYSLKLFLKTSKFSQGFFTVINFNKDSITVIPPLISKHFFRKLKIDRGDLSDAELVLNVSDSQRISGNMKFPSNQKISVIADRIIKPYRLDVREASNMQLNTNQRWIMSVYSIEESALIGGKDTAGLFKIVNNRNVKDIKLDDFGGSKVECYVDSSQKKLGEERLRLVGKNRNF